jgi:hypothetical protein
VVSVAKRSTPIACVPGAIPSEERAAHFVLARRLFAEVAESREPLPDGYVFRLPADALGSVAQFVANERKCCPFMRFEIVVSAESDSIVLRMTGPEGTRNILDAELNLTTCGSGDCGCND